MSIKFLVWGGGGVLGFGGGSADFIFMGAGIFLTIRFLQNVGRVINLPSFSAFWLTGDHPCWLALVMSDHNKQNQTAQQKH